MPPAVQNGLDSRFSSGKTFPNSPQFSAFMKPCRVEGDVGNLEIVGSVPESIDGTFYRVMPDPQLPPYIENDPWFNGDGNVSAFRIANGSVHWKQRYIRTEKFQREREAQKALCGKYRNKYTDAVEFKVRTTANTNVVHWNGKLLAMKEDAAPYAMNPQTLETIGVWDFNGQLPSATFTAHPKFDPTTKEMICFGYEAKGDGTPDICYFSIDESGKFTETVWVVAPVVAMIHDFAVTENWVLFPMIPQLCDLERLKNGGEHWQWSPETPFYLGVLPRRGAKATDVKWFTYPNSFPGHTLNAYEDSNGKLVLDLPLSEKNVFFWWPDAKGRAPDPHEISSKMVRFNFDPTTNEVKLPEPSILVEEDCEFPRIDERISTQEHSHAFYNIMIPQLGTDFSVVGPAMGGGFPPYNALGHLNLKTGEKEVYYPGPHFLVQEPVFLPRSAEAKEGDGYLMALVNNYENMLSELHIVDTRSFDKVQAIVKLPVKLRPGLHGNWVDAADLAI